MERQAKDTPKTKRHTSPHAIKGTPLELHIDDVLSDACYKDAFQGLVSRGVPRKQLEELLCKVAPIMLVLVRASRPDTHATLVGRLNILEPRKRTRVAKLARSLTRLLRENHDLHYSRLLTDLSALRADAESPLERAPTLATEDVFCLNFIRTVKNATGNPQYELVSILIASVTGAMWKKEFISRDAAITKRFDSIADESRLKKLWTRNRALLSRFDTR